MPPETQLPIIGFDDLMTILLEHLIQRGYKPQIVNKQPMVVHPTVGLPLPFSAAIKVEMNEWFRKAAEKALQHK
jgi:hypothetical protein